MKRHRKKHPPPADEGAYACRTCGETIVIPLDPSGGIDQQDVEDCPVCGRYNLSRFRATWRTI
jgi:ribosomal protein L37AE/L43A